MSLKKGDKVKVHYTGTLEDGTVFDSSEKTGKPLEFEIGSGMIIKGFEKAVIDLKKGEETSITLQPSDAYGDVNPQLIKDIPREHLPKEQEPKEGMMLMVGLPNGHQLPAMIKEVKADSVKIDINHPLAGKVLNFKITLVEVESKK